MNSWLRTRALIDRVVAAMLLALASPLLLAIAVYVVLDDGRPVFIRVPRVGRGGRPFGLWKVRTMVAAGPGGLAGGPSLTTSGDARLTRAGARLRSRRVDEIPQLVNVVTGDMALIGPRPEAPSYVDLHDERWPRVLAARPGIAGASQVLLEAWELEVLREQTTASYETAVLPVKLAVDEWYIRNASPRVDVAITKALLGWAAGRGATKLRDQIESDVPELESVAR